MRMVKVRRAKHTAPRIPNKRGPMNWNVIQPLSDGTELVFTYASYNLAVYNAHRIAHHQYINPVGLRGMCSRVAEAV